MEEYIEKGGRQLCMTQAFLSNHVNPTLPFPVCLKAESRSGTLLAASKQLRSRDLRFAGSRLCRWLSLHLTYVPRLGARCGNAG